MTAIEKDEDIIKDFFGELDDHLDKVKNIVNNIHPDDITQEEINILFRAVHSVKGNLCLLGLNEVANLIHGMENILSKVREREIKYSVDLGKLLCVGLEKTKLTSIQCFNNEAPDDELIYINTLMEEILHSSSTSQQAMITRTLQELEDDEYMIETTAVVSNVSDSCTDDIVVNIKQDNEDVQINDKLDLRMQKDLSFFKEISFAVAKRLNYDVDRIPYMLHLAGKMNDFAGNKVAEIQLHAGIYMALWGLGMLPLSLHETSMLNNEQEKLIKLHPNFSAQFFQYLQEWNEAKTFVLQCHEQFGGNGYPNNLEGNQITDGAKIISIVQAFSAMFFAKKTKDKDNISQQELIDLIEDISCCVGQQFDGEWINVFKKVVLLVHKELFG